jgi:hypothetical protein
MTLCKTLKSSPGKIHSSVSGIREIGERLEKRAAELCACLYLLVCTENARAPFKHRLVLTPFLRAGKRKRQCLKLT